MDQPHVRVDQFARLRERVTNANDHFNVFHPTNIFGDACKRHTLFFNGDGDHAIDLYK